MVEELAVARALEECLEAMERGETDLDALAGRYPEAEEEIRPLLKLAKRLYGQGSGGLALSPAFKEELRQRLTTHRLNG